REDKSDWQYADLPRQSSMLTDLSLCQHQIKITNSTTTPGKWPFWSGMVGSNSSLRLTLRSNDS
ncbi:MAG: hypothetical protein KGZ25_10710, partial [Planctomycetes bacterium]|nr:hypothetical protein [Planctomycetota bacterium]